MEPYGSPWKVMEGHGMLWNIPELHGMPWNLLEGSCGSVGEGYHKG